jgi:hypothetical protein
MTDLFETFRVSKTYEIQIKDSSLNEVVTVSAGTRVKDGIDACLLAWGYPKGTIYRISTILD